MVWQAALMTPGPWLILDNKNLMRLHEKQDKLYLTLSRGPPKSYKSKPGKTTQNTEKVAHNPNFWLQGTQITEAGVYKRHQQVFFCRCVSLLEVLA